jgi:hypothetical protein
MLVAYSDGVTECRNAEDQEFEMERLIAATKRVGGVQASKALFSLLATVLDFAESCSQNDDLTLLVVRRRDLIKEQFLSSGRDGSSLTKRLTSGTRPKRFDQEGKVQST